MEEQEPPCECATAGFCPRYQLSQNEFTHARCQGANCTPEKANAFRKKWRLQLAETTPKPVVAPTPDVQRLKERLECIYRGDKLAGQGCGNSLYHCTLDNTICNSLKPCPKAERCCQTCPHFQKNVRVDPVTQPPTPTEYKRFEFKGDGPAVYCHSGDYGDIIYSLHAVHDLQAETGRRAEYALAPVRGTRAYMDAKHAANLIPLLEAQTYLSKAYWSPVHVGIRLDLMTRKFWNGNATNLQEHYAHVLNLAPAHPQGAWLTVPEPQRLAPVVICRSKRYRGPFPWTRVYAAVKQHAVFVGTPSEYDDFRRVVGPLEYCPTKTLLEVAQVIAGADLFIGNQSCPRAIAEGLKKPIIVETGNPDDTRFDRPDAWYSGGNKDFWCEALEKYEGNEQVHSASVSGQSVHHKVLCGPGNRCRSG